MGLRPQTAWVVRDILVFLRPRSMCCVRNFSLILGIVEETIAISFMREFLVFLVLVSYIVMELIHFSAQQQAVSKFQFNLYSWEFGFETACGTGCA